MSFEVCTDFHTLECEQFCARVADGTHDSPKEASDGKLLVTSKNVKDGRLSLDSAYLISKKDFDNINKRSKVDQWDLLLTMIGTVGEVCLITSKNPDFAIKNVGLLKCGNELKAKWLYYFLRSPQGQRLIEQRKKGSTQQYISLTEIRGLPVSFPKNVGLMGNIVDVLTCLDDRITLLRETNTTLEAIAQALFKSWFVDFDPVRDKMADRVLKGMDETTAMLFPNGFENLNGKLLPKGWRIGKVSELGQVVCGKTPSTSEADNYGSDVPFITIPDMHGHLVVTSTRRNLSLKGASTQRGKYLPEGAVCVSCIATPGLVARITKPSQTNQQINSVIPAAQWGKSFSLFSLLQIGEAVKTGGSGGSVFHNLSKSGFENLPTLLPTEKIAALFDELVEPIVLKIISNQEHTEVLSTLRDTLLPRLISGQLRLPQAQVELEAAGAI
ncbi:restriction endonuclease subunit S [Azohydromonas australica]|uniref:restriction endonuclease subunit S n=1 Tax=Azohydromonas australica TaxID=364039 RepID=UPI00041219C8|nr:restriction endonuclease subunit S [Azohydromonas australica]